MNAWAVDDELHMRRALALAALGLDTVDPNPRVGCVLVRDGRVVGEGYHHKAIGVHKALADRFSLLEVTIMPDGCWARQK